MSVPKPLDETLSEQTIALPRDHAGAERRSSAGVRAWLFTAILFLVPVVTYWPATFHDYGLRDDYSNLREAHEEPAAVLKFCASHARPIYGWLLQSSYGQTDTVQGLQWMRFCSALLLGAISLIMFRALRSFGWSYNASLCFAILLSLAPSAQVIGAWAVGWPYAVTVLPAIAAFFTAEGALTVGLRAGIPRALGQWSLAFGLLVVSALIYQPSALFYVVPLAGALIARPGRGPVRTVRWLAFHLACVAASLALAYGVMTLLYTAGIFVKSGRIAFEHHWGAKIAWYFQENLPNALSLFVLNDDHLRDHGWYVAGAVLVGSILLAGAAVEWRRHGRARGLLWLVGLTGLPMVALSVSLVASEHYATYRTIFSMTAVLLCFLVASVRALTENWTLSSRRLASALVVTFAFFMAQHHAYALIAVPQGNEWQLILQGAKHVRIDGPAHPRIFVIASSPADISTATIYHDEFGSLSSNSEWVPKEMFKRAMHDLHPDVANLDARYDISEGYKLPPGGDYDMVIDMHQLRRFRTDN